MLVPRWKRGVGVEGAGGEFEESGGEINSEGV